MYSVGMCAITGIYTFEYICVCVHMCMCT
jgi:hypothetical protein